MPGRARLAPWRGVGNGHNAFAAESFLDEIAKDLGTTVSVMLAGRERLPAPSIAVTVAMYVPGASTVAPIRPVIAIAVAPGPALKRTIVAAG